MHLHHERRFHGRSEVVLLHGLTRRWQTFTPLLPSLESRYSLTLLDLPGHGQSDPNPAGYLVKDYADAIIAWIDGYPVESFVLYGHSLGAMVALHAAAERPDRVKQLVLEDPPLDTMGQRIAETIWMSHFSQVHQLRNHEPFLRANRAEQVAMLADIILTDPSSGISQRLGDQRDASSLRFMAACMLKMDSGVVRPVIENRWLDDWDWCRTASRVRQPTLILRADERSGGMLTERDADRLCELLVDAVPVLFKNSGHNLHWLRSQDVCNCVHTFLDS
ncbi:MAG: alpha/beta fold hydrolase [Planctomycetota bacterium]|jgi:pimeloyl-ACP methyl ester carboxylesterase